MPWDEGHKEFTRSLGCSPGGALLHWIHHVILIGQPASQATNLKWVNFGPIGWPRDLPSEEYEGARRPSKAFTASFFCTRQLVYIMISTYQTKETGGGACGTRTSPPKVKSGSTQSLRRDQTESLWIYRHGYRHGHGNGHGWTWT